MRLTQIVLSILFAFTLLFSPGVFAQDEASPSGATEKVDVLAVFWPVVPGTTVADGTFFLKQLKEAFGDIFTFGTVAKSLNQLEISEKRLVEASKLIDSKDFNNAFKSIEMNAKAREQAVELKRKAAEEKADTLELTNKLVKSLENQEKALMYLTTLMPEDQKTKMADILKQLPLEISEAK